MENENEKRFPCARIDQIWHEAVESILAQPHIAGLASSIDGFKLAAPFSDGTLKAERRLVDHAQAEELALLALRARLATVEGALAEEEKTRLAEAAAAEALRRKLQDADAELTAMILALEEQRRAAEETLNVALARVAAEVRKRLALEAAERRLEEENELLRLSLSNCKTQTGNDDCGQGRSGAIGGEILRFPKN